MTFDEREFQETLEQSLQDAQPDSPGGIVGNPSLFMFWPGIEREVIPAWGSLQRTAAQRRFAYDHRNTLVMSGITQAIISPLTQTAWKIIGGRNRTRFHTEMFQRANNYHGWDEFISQLWFNYHVYDVGAFVYLQAPGESTDELDSPVYGLEVLDSARCYTPGRVKNKDGYWEEPLYYWALYGTLHKIHRSRYVRLVDNPSSDPFWRGTGFSALSRAIAISQLQILMMQYEQESLDNQPPKGFLSISGVNNTQWTQIKQQYHSATLPNGANPVFPGLMEAVSLDPGSPVKIEVTPFSTLPEGFNYSDMMRDHVNLVALALGVDPQDIWPLTGGALGTGAQSRVLAEKGKAKTFGQDIQLFERIVNISILPVDLEFKFQPTDLQQDMNTAQVAQIYVNIGLSLQSLGVEEENVLQFLADNVPSFADVLLDEAGLIKLPDDDPKTPEQEDTVGEDTTTLQTPEQAEQDTTTGNDSSTLETNASDTEDVTQDDTSKARKDIQSTRLDFEGDFEDALSGAMNGNLDRVRFGTVLRALIRRYGQAAYYDGLESGGVNREDATAEDLQSIREMTVSQSGYITAFADTVFSEGLTEAQAATKPAMWYNGSIDPFYTAGLISADRNGMYEFAGDDGNESCIDCRRLKGQRHRLIEWKRRDKIPPNREFECKGYQCRHRLVKTTERARGGF